MATNSLTIKDGNGIIKSLAVNSGSFGFIPEHAISGAVTVTASLSNPVGVKLNYREYGLDTGVALVVKTTGSSQSDSTWVTGTVTTNISSSNSAPLIVSQAKASSATKTKYFVGSGIDYTNASSGTFEMAEQSETRKGLVIFNPSANDLYVALGSGSTNGFILFDGTGSAPTSYSFIIYSSGTYIAEDAVIGMFHGGFFVSSSQMNPSVFVTKVQ